MMTELATVSPPGVDRFPVRKPMPRAQFDALSREILVLKKQLNAVILAHNYQVPEIQDIADYVGDSLGLSQQAAQTKADVIVFSGVHFMAETAKILSPDKIVVLPDKDAGCSLEESCPADKLAAFQKTNPNFYTITYINCSAAVKALSDVICTSGNAVKIVNASPKDKDLLFVPDENLGEWVREQTGRPMTLWLGNCYAHVEFRRESLLRVKQSHPQAKVVVHPESLREVRELADAVCSTEKMITYCQTSPAKQFVVVTESGIIHRLQKECPGKEFVCAPTFDVMRAPTDPCRCSECKYMKMNTLEKVRDCMKNLSPRIELPAEIIRRAHEVGAVTLVDGAQSVPHKKTDVTELDCDFLAFSGHKMLGPSGVGVLYGKRELLEAMPPMFGGGGMIRHVELDRFTPGDLPQKFEAGTPPIVQAIALGAAVDYLNAIGMDAIQAHDRLLARRAHEVLAAIPGIRIIGPAPEHKGGLVSFVLDRIHAHDAAELLDRKGIAVRAGHHCTMPLHKRFGVTATARASFYLYNTLDEIDKLGEALVQTKEFFHRRKPA